MLLYNHVRMILRTGRQQKQPLRARPAPKKKVGGGSCESHVLRHSGEPWVGSGAGVGIQNRSKILDSKARFACLE